MSTAPPPPDTPSSLFPPPFVLSEGRELYIRPPKVGCTTPSRSRRTTHNHNIPNSTPYTTSRGYNTSTPYHVYILPCSDGSYYTGHTESLEARLAAHQSGHIEGYTQTRRPVTLVFTQEFPTRQEALASERQIKGWKRAKKEALIAGNWQTLSGRSKKDRSPSSNS